MSRPGATATPSTEVKKAIADVAAGASAVQGVTAGVPAAGNACATDSCLAS